MSDRNSVGYTLLVALVLCVVCSVVVSTAAVGLRPLQESNRKLDRDRNVLEVAGLYRPGEHDEEDVERLMGRFSQRLVDLEQGDFVTGAAAQRLVGYDARRAARDPELSRSLAEDPAGIGRLPRYARVYLLEEDGVLQRIVLPVYGYGLWGTLYGYLALAGDGNTVIGLGFYEHKETPGLGGEVENPRWRAQWAGKRVYDLEGMPRIRLAKGALAMGEDPRHRIDALSGATLTSRGVENMIHFWLGESGFGPLLERLIRSRG